MQDAIIILAINTLLVLFLWHLYFFEYRTYRLDLTRQRLFRIRDELFAEFDRHGWPFDARAYGIMRRTLNGVIRFNHRLSLSRYWGAVLADREVANGELGRRFEEEFQAALAELPQDAQECVLKARREMHDVVIEHMVLSSLLATLVAAVAFCLFLTHRLVSVLLKKSSSFDAEAEIVGRQTISA